MFKPDKDDKGQPTPDEELQELLEGAHGKPLRRIPIFLLAGTRDGNMDASFRWYGKLDSGATLICYGDGETGHRVLTEEGNDGAKRMVIGDDGWPRRGEMECPCGMWNPDPEVDQRQHPCKWSCKMGFMLQDAPRGGGYFLFRTHSLRTIRNLHFALTQMEHFTLKNMTGIPITLVMENQKNKRNQTIPVARIEWDFNPNQLRLKAIEQVRSTADLRKQIEAADAVQAELIATESPEEMADVAGEFYADDGGPPAGEGEKEPESVTDVVELPEGTEPSSAEPPAKPKKKAAKKTGKKSPKKAAPAKPPEENAAGEEEGSIKDQVLARKEGNSPVIGDVERRELFGRMDELGVDPDMALQIVVEITGKDSTAGLTHDEWGKIMRVINHVKSKGEAEDWLKYEQDKRKQEEGSAKEGFLF
jgi:hypothetical protein